MLIFKVGHRVGFVRTLSPSLCSHCTHVWHLLIVSGSCVTPRLPPVRFLDLENDVFAHCQVTCLVSPNGLGDVPGGDRWGLIPQCNALLSKLNQCTHHYCHLWRTTKSGPLVNVSPYSGESTVERVHLGYLKTFEESSDWFSRHLDSLLALQPFASSLK